MPRFLGFIIAPARSAGASYSGSGVSNDQVCIRSSGKKCVYGKSGQNTQNMCAGFNDTLFAVFEQSIFKVPKKTEESRPRNELPGPKKSDVFLKMMKT